MPQYTKKNYDPVKTSQYNHEYYMKHRQLKGYKDRYGGGLLGKSTRPLGRNPQLTGTARPIQKNGSGLGTGPVGAGYGAGRVSRAKQNFQNGLLSLRNNLNELRSSGKLTVSKKRELVSRANALKDSFANETKMTDKERKARAAESTARANMAKAKQKAESKTDNDVKEEKKKTRFEEGKAKGEAIRKLLNGEDSKKKAKSASSAVRSSGSRGSSGSGRGNGTTANAKANSEPKDPDSLAGLSDSQREAAKKAKERLKKQQEKEIARRRARLNDDIKKMHEVDSNGNATSGLYQKIKALQDACDRDIEKIKEKYVKKYRALLKRMRSNPDYTGSSGKTSKKKRKKGKKAVKGKVAQDTKAVKSEERKANQRLKRTT